MTKRDRPGDFDTCGDLDYYYPKLKKRKIITKNHDDDEGDLDDSEFGKLFLKGLLGKSVHSSSDNDKDVYSKDNHIYFHAACILYLIYINMKSPLNL